jgi:predicted NodU family carbamoyl transferase
MHVLGISCFFHDAAAALVKDGVLVAAAEEERFSRKKHDYEFPMHAIDYVLAAGGLTAADLDHVAFFEKPFLKFERILMTSLQMFPAATRLFREAMVTWLLDKLWVVRYERLDDERLLDCTVEALMAGQVVGWAQDRFEWGPRALGHRSILADPRRADMKDIVNTKIKFREPYRPFAPSVLAPRVHDYFNAAGLERQYPARFMLLVTPVREAKRDVIPAVTHVDGTGRCKWWCERGTRDITISSSASGRRQAFPSS